MSWVDKSRTGNDKAKKHGINWFLIAILVIVGYCSCILINQQLTLSALNSDIENARERLATAQSENQKLKEENQLLTDDVYVEKLAREELGMTRQGEMPYIYAANK